MSLANLLTQATPGPWQFNDTTDPRGHKGELRAPSPHNGFALVSRYINADDMALAALAPELAQLVEDMAAWIESVNGAGNHTGAALLARKADLDRKATP